MVIHKYVVRGYPSSIIDFTGFLEVSFAVEQESEKRLGSADYVGGCLNDLVITIFLSDNIIRCANIV